MPKHDRYLEKLEATQQEILSEHATLREHRQNHQAWLQGAQLPHQRELAALRAFAAVILGFDTGTKDDREGDNE